METAAKTPRVKRKKRIQLGVIISPEMRSRLKGMMRKTGQSYGQCAEELMMLAFAYKDLIAATRIDIEEIHKGNVVNALHRLGYASVSTPDSTGKVFRAWLEPGHPNAPPRSGFEPYQPGEQPTGQVTVGETEIVSEGPKP